MDYCTSLLGKKLNDLTFQDIEVYFDQERNETDQLEFKSISQTGVLGDNFLNIQKSICALLNSSGGLIILGSPIGQKSDGRREKKFKGALTFFSQTIEKDFIVSKISDNIIPAPNSIRVAILENDQKTILIIEVDSSEYSPHQTSGIYYMRIDGQSKPAPHHYIEALFKKIRYPNIEAYFRITKIETFQSFYRIYFDIFFFNWSPLQNEEKLSFSIVADGIFSRARNPQFQHMYNLNGHQYYNENTKDIFYFGEPVLESESILVDIKEIAKKENKVRVFISFGGRFSPRKSSQYVFDLAKCNEDKPGELVIEKDENRLTKDIQDEKGLDKGKIIESFMNT